MLYFLYSPHISFRRTIGFDFLDFVAILRFPGEDHGPRFRLYPVLSK